MTSTALTIVTWNVNSIRARKERVVAWLAAVRPDVVLLQETKVEDAEFPRDEIAALGYEIALHGQRTYNGVAILSRLPLTDVTSGLSDGVLDDQARLIAATVAGVRVICCYVPNGQTVGTEKFAYKLRWLGRLRQYLDARCDPALPLLVGGDFNVAPEARDVHDPGLWEPTVLFHPEVRVALTNVSAFGLKDALRLVTEDAGLYSWWDYRMLGFAKNRGLRIDLLLLTPSLAARLETVRIDRNERKGKLASDHAPVIGTFRA